MRFFTLLFLLFPFVSKAQICSGPGRTPQTGIAVCGTLTFPQTNVPSCTGATIPQTACSVTLNSNNSVWYKFHCYQSGTLGFLISPASGTDDYDWDLMDVTGHAPQDVFTSDLRISLNLSANAGNTGCTPTGTSDVNCENNTSPFNRMPLLTSGNDYLLMVQNWSNSGLGYNLIFNGGTAVLTNGQPPTVSNVGIVGCNTSLLKIVFSEEILCNSLTGTWSEFTITNGTHVISSVSSICSSGNNAFSELTLALQAPLPPGNYQLVVNNGSDLNTLLDVCEDAIPTGASFPFTVPVQNPLAINHISFAGCAPSILKVALAKPVMCNSITSSGSEFSITPGNPLITAVQSACNSGATYTDTLKIILQNPLPQGSYVLTVNNGADGNTLIDTCGTALATGYQFPFIINQLSTAPVIQSVGFDECKPFRVVVNFDKPVACNSLTANGSEFSLTPGTLSVTGITNNCNNGFTSQVVLILSGNLPAGNFNVKINNGTDGNTLSDSCFSFMPVNSIKPFTTTLAPPPVFDSLQYDKCEPAVIKVFYSKAINCTSINPNGTEFSITGPSPVSITAVSNDNTCSAGFTNWVLLHLSQPINIFGTYVLHNLAGADGNSVSDTCSAVQQTTETIAFNVLGRPSASFTDEVRWGCDMDTIRMSHPGGNGINSWTWNFSDGTTASGQTLFHTFPVSTVSATIQLIVSNGLCNDTLQRSYPLNNAFTTAFSISADTTCRNVEVNFTNNSSGNNLQYLWQYGDNTLFNGQNPPPHTYLLSDSFYINLIITNNIGCSDTATKKIMVTDLPVVGFSGLNTQYCTGETVTLVSNLQGSITGYSWITGTGSNFADQPAISYPYNVQGSYTVSLVATDRYCGDVTTEAVTQVYQLPVFDLGNNKTLCPGLTIQIGVNNVSGYTYLWNNGETGSKIITALQSDTYRLTVNNNGCVSDDAVFVEVLNNCLIKVPRAFTPNNDGLNDRLKAINADLATKFSLSVYNRFGQMLYTTVNPIEGWNGMYKGLPAETGTYVWQLRYIDPVSKKPVYEKGTSLLIR